MNWCSYVGIQGVPGHVMVVGNWEVEEVVDDGADGVASTGAWSRWLSIQEAGDFANQIDSFARQAILYGVNNRRIR